MGGDSAPRIRKQRVAGTIPNGTTQNFVLLILKQDLSVSIRRRALHKIWVVRKITEPDLELEDPLVVTRDADIPLSRPFFLFVTYILKFDLKLYLKAGQ